MSSFSSAAGFGLPKARSRSELQATTETRSSSRLHQLTESLNGTKREAASEFDGFAIEPAVTARVAALPGPPVLARNAGESDFPFPALIAGPTVPVIARVYITHGSNASEPSCLPALIAGPTVPVIARVARSKANDVHRQSGTSSTRWARAARRISTRYSPGKSGQQHRLRSAHSMSAPRCA